MTWLDLYNILHSMKDEPVMGERVYVIMDSDGIHVDLVRSMQEKKDFLCLVQSMEVDDGVGE